MKSTIQKICLQIHLYLGVASSLILIIICSTGAILVFENELLQLTDRDLHYSEPGGKSPLSYEEIIRITESDGHWAVKGMMIYPGEGRNLQLMVEEKHPEHPEDGEDHHHGKSISVNPFTGQVAEQKSATDSFFHSVMQLHRWLLADAKVGRPITGAATVIFLVISLTGLILYLPPKVKAWFKRRHLLPSLDLRNIPNKAFPLHLRLGYYALIPLLIMGFSGLIWSYPSYYKGLEKLLGDKLGKQRFDKPIELPIRPDSLTAYRVPIANLIHTVDSALTYPAKIYRIDFPEDASNSVMIRKKSAAFFAYDAADKIQLNPYSGEIIEIDRFKDWSFSSKIAALIRTLHVGSFIGFTSKLIYFLAALVATSLPVTGLIIWTKKIKQKRQFRQRMK